MRSLRLKKDFAAEDILQLIDRTDLSDPNTFLVLNGGTGVGKTTAIMEQVQDKLDKKFHHLQTMLIVESRTTTTEQLRHKYNEIDICQRIRFAHLIQKKEVDYDWVVIDECHGIFSEAGFAEDTTIIADWIKYGRENTHIIFVTANDEYFDELSKQFFPENYRFIYLFPDFTEYVSNTYVKQIEFIKTNRLVETLEYFLHELRDQRGIVFLKKAGDVKDWFFELLGRGEKVGMLVSRANETALALNPTQKALMDPNVVLNLTDGRSGLTLADLQIVLDQIRLANGQESIHQALLEERLPEDIKILLATDTLQEGMSIKIPKLDYIIVEGYTEVDIRQKLGRFRGNLNQLYIIFNPNAAARSAAERYKIFQNLMELEKAGETEKLAEFYGAQQAAKFKTIYLTKKILKNGKNQYELNVPALLGLQRDMQTYQILMDNTQEGIKTLYSFPLLTGEPKLLEYKDIRAAQDLENIVQKWRGIPLKGPAQAQLVQQFIDNGITDKNGRKITTFVRACNTLREAGYELVQKQATRQDLASWPQYLSRLKEKFLEVNQRIEK